MFLHWRERTLAVRLSATGARVVLFSWQRTDHRPAPCHHRSHVLLPLARSVSRHFLNLFHTLSLEVDSHRKCVRVCVSGMPTAHRRETSGEKRSNLGDSSGPTVTSGNSLLHFDSLAVTSSNNSRLNASVQFAFGLFLAGRVSEIRKTRCMIG